MPGGDDDDYEQLRPTTVEEWKRSTSRGMSAMDRLAWRAAAREASELVNRPETAAAIAAAAEAQRVSLSRSMELFVDSFRSLWESLRPHFEEVVRVLARMLPPNWEGVDLEDGVALAAGGWPIVWAPRGEIVNLLLDATTDAERHAVLERHAQDVLDDIDHQLAETAEAGQTAIVDAMRQAVAAARAGLWIPGQITAAAALDSLVGAETMIKDHVGAIDARYSDDEVVAIEFRLALILRAVPRAFSEFWVDRGDPLPTDFNRHAAVHRLSHENLNVANALFGLLLVASLIRELVEYGDEEISIGGLVLRPARPGQNHHS